MRQSRASRAAQVRLFLWAVAGLLLVLIVMGLLMR
jgi:hypothetical protein